jgi:leader peptidase (prepilin peptidase)/N-methyltransferase
MIDQGIPHWLVAALIAPFVGSFLGVLAVRLPARRQVVAGRSQCPDCHATLGLADLVPLLSWLAARGRCRHCGAPIDRFYPAIELAALMVPLWAASETTGWVLWAGCGLGWCLLALAVMDMRSMVLADSLTWPLVAAGLAVSGALGTGTLRGAAIGAALGFVSFALIGWLYRKLRRREGLGLGDAKLLAAAGAWLTWPALPSVVALAALSGLATVLARSLAGRPLGAGERLPFGPHLGAATWLVWLYGPVVAG